MKQITELTEQEILALTDDQLSKMVQYKMAEAGIKILDKPVEPEYHLMPPKEIIVYSVDGVKNFFTSKTEATTVHNLLCDVQAKMVSASYPNYDYNLGWVEKPVPANYSFHGWGEIKEVQLYTKDTADSIKSLVEKNKELKKQYDADLKEYHDADNASSDIKAMIYGTFNDVHKKYHNMAEMQYHYQRYLKLADGNEIIAMNFLKAAYSIDEQTEYYVQGKEMPEIADEEEYHTTAKSEGCAN